MDRGGPTEQPRDSCPRPPLARRGRRWRRGRRALQRVVNGRGGHPVLNGSVSLS